MAGEKYLKQELNGANNTVIYDEIGKRTETNYIKWPTIETCMKMHHKSDVKQR